MHDLTIFIYSCLYYVKYLYLLFPASQGVRIAMSCGARGGRGWWRMRTGRTRLTTITPRLPTTAEVRATLTDVYFIYIYPNFWVPYWYCTYSLSASMWWWSFRHYAYGATLLLFLLLLTIIINIIISSGRFLFIMNYFVMLWNKNVKQFPLSAMGWHQMFIFFVITVPDPRLNDRHDGPFDSYKSTWAPTFWLVVVNILFLIKNRFIVNLRAFDGLLLVLDIISEDDSGFYSGSLVHVREVVGVMNFSYVFTKSSRNFGVDSTLYFRLMMKWF